MIVDNNKAMENVGPRPDIRDKVTGKAKYVADVLPKNIIFGKIIRFPWGKGTVKSANLDAARAVSGVLECVVDVGADCSYCGQRIGHVVAASRDAIEDAIDALDLEFTRETARSRPMELYEGLPELEAGDKSRLDGIYGRAAHVVEAVYTTQVQTHSCLEPHGSMVDFREDSLEAWVSTQAVMGCEGELADAMGMPASRVTVHSEYVGGGFGSKFSIGAEGRLAANMSKKYGRPCRVALDRREEHLDAGNRPGSIQYMKFGLDGDGRIIGGRMHLASIVGFTGTGGGVRAPNYYKFGDVVRSEAGIPLNAGLPRAFRAPGFPQASFAMESLMDELAAAAGMDPVAFRKLNETSNRRRKQLDWGAELIGWTDRKPDGTRPEIVKVGFGCGGASWGNSPGSCEAETDIYRSGDLEVRVGIQDIGTGASTLPVDVTAWHLGLPREWITGKVGNSDYPPGPASGGSVTSRFTAPAIRDSNQKALDKLRLVVAREWGVDLDKVSYEKGTFRGDGKTIRWKDACSLMSGEKITARGEFNQQYYGEGDSDCVQFARVSVDTETGIVRVEKIVAIQACGKPINRLTAENQICGGVIQGISYALFEDRILDGPTGGQTNADFISYKIAGSVDVPEIIPVLDVIDSDTGVRSIGEPTTIPTSGAVANAVANAIGVRVRDLPITPRRVLEALAKKGSVA